MLDTGERLLLKSSNMVVIGKWGDVMGGLDWEEEDEEEDYG